LAHSPNPEVDVEGDADAVGRVGGRKAVLEVMCAHCETRDGRRVRAWNAKEILDSRREVDAKGKNIDETSSKPGGLPNQKTMGRKTRKKECVPRSEVLTKYLSSQGLRMRR